MRSEKVVQWSLSLWRGGWEAEEALQEISKVLAVRREGNMVYLSGQVQTAAPVGEGDPVTIAVCLMMGLVGPFWPFIYPKVLGEVNRKWKESVKESSSRKKPLKGG